MLYLVGMIISGILIIIALIAGVIAEAVPVTQYNYPASISSGALVLVVVMWIIISIFYKIKK